MFDFDDIISAIKDLPGTVEGVAGDLADEVKKVEAIADIVGDGIVGAYDAVGGGVIDLGNDVAHMAESALVGVIDITRSSALELAEFTEHAAGEVAHFSEHAFHSVRDALAEVARDVLEWLAAAFTETLPELDDPSDAARTVAQSILLSQYFTSEQLCRSTGMTILHGVSAGAGAASATAGVYVTRDDGAAKWGFFRGASLDGDSFVLGAEATLFTTFYYGSAADASGATVLVLGVEGKIGPLTIEGKLLFENEWPPMPVGARYSAGVSIGPGKKGGDVSRLKIRPGDDLTPLALVEARDAYDFGRQLVNSADAAVRAALQPASADRAKATAQLASRSSGVFTPVGHGQLAMGFTRPGAPDVAAVICVGEPDPAAPDRRRARVVWSDTPGARTRVRAMSGLADPERLSFEAIGPTPLYLEARLDGGVVFSPWSDDQGWRQRCTFDRRPLRADSHAAMLQPHGTPFILWHDNITAADNAPVTLSQVSDAEPPDEWKAINGPRCLFTLAPLALPREQTATLLPEHRLAAGEFRRAPDGLHFVTLRHDGSLVVARGAGPNDTRAVLWQSPTHPGDPCFALLDERGRLGIHRVSDAAAAAPLWRSPVVTPLPAHGWPSAWFAVVTDTGALAVFTGLPERPDALVWDSATGEARPWPVARAAVALRASNGALLGAAPGANAFIADVVAPAIAREHLGPHEALTLATLCDGSVDLSDATRTHLGLFVRNGIDGLGSLARTAGGRATDRFQPVWHGPAELSLRASNGKYLTYNPAAIGPATVTATAADPGPHTRFAVCPLGADPVVRSGQTFRVVDVATGRPLEPQGDSMQRLQPIVLGDADPTREGQRWIVKHLGDGEFVLSGELSGLAFDVEGGSTQAGARVVSYRWHGGPNQRFRLLPGADGSFALVASHSGQVLAASGGGGLIQRSRQDGPLPRLRLEPVRARNANAVPLAIDAEWGAGNFLYYNFTVLPGRAKAIIGGPGGDIRWLITRFVERPIPDVTLTSTARLLFGDTRTFRDGEPVQVAATASLAFALTPPPSASSATRDRVRDYHVCYQLYLMDRGLTDVVRDGAPCHTDNRKVEGIVLWIAERLPRLVDARARVRDAAAPLMGQLFCLRNRATGKVLQIAGASLENGAAVTQGPSTGGAAQKFWVCHIPSRDLCFLFAHHSKRLLTIQDASDDSGRPAIQWQLGGGDNQLFAVFPDPDQPDWFVLAAENSRRFLGVLAGAHDGAPVVQADITQARRDCFRWQFVPAEPTAGPDVRPWTHELLSLPLIAAMQLELDVGLKAYLGRPVHLVARHSGRALEVPDGRADDGVGLVQGRFLAADHQKWTISHVGGGYCTLTNRQTGKYIDIAGAQPTHGAAAVQASAHGGDSQRFLLTATGEGHYTIVARHSGQALDVEGGGQASGARVLQWPVHGGLNQQWKISPAATESRPANSFFAPLRIRDVAHLLSLEAVRLRSWKGDYLVRPDAPTGVATAPAGDVWRVSAASGGRIYLRSRRDDYLHRPDAPPAVTTSGPVPASEWTLEVNGDTVRLRSWKGDALHRPDSPMGVTAWPVGGGNEWVVEAMDL